jgi:hypothetical protein
MRIDTHRWLEDAAIRYVSLECHILLPGRKCAVKQCRHYAFIFREPVGGNV